MRYSILAILILISTECTLAGSGESSENGTPAFQDHLTFVPAEGNRHTLNTALDEMSFSTELKGRSGLPATSDRRSVSPGAIAKAKDVYQRQARGRTIFIVNMSLAGGFGALATWAGVRGKKKEDFEASFVTTLTSVGLGIVGTGHLILGMGVGLPLWKAKGKERPENNIP